MARDVINIPGVSVGAIAGLRACKRVAGGWEQITTQGARVDGISMFDSADGKGNTFFVLGEHEIVCGAALADAEEWMSDNQGRAIPFVTGAGVYRGGISQGVTTAAGQTVTVSHANNIVPAPA